MNTQAAIRQALRALRNNSIDLEARIPRYTNTTAGDNAKARAKATLLANAEAMEALGALSDHLADQAAPSPITETCPSSRSYTGRGDDRLNCPTCNRRVATTGGGHIIRHARLAPAPSGE